MHQPDYREPQSNRLAMPWVRLHATKDYLDMPLAAVSHDNVRVTFNLVPSLLDQLQLYLKGGTDHHLDLSRSRVEDLQDGQKLEMLQSFFAGNPTYMVEPYSRFRQLHRKYKSGTGDLDSLPSLFSSSELRDLQVWSNLTWVDPRFREEEPVRSLFTKKRHFTEEDKQSLLDWQLDLIGRIIPTYRKLQDEGRIEVSFTPYYHPILPLLCDTDVAREALPSISLPRKRFVHPEDARRQVGMAREMYRDLFGRDMIGMWPSEGSVSEEALRILAENGVEWAATDQEILEHSLGKSNLPSTDNPIHRVYEFDSSVKLFFRDHALSDRIGFVYSTWPADRAVDDFMGHIKHLRSVYLDSLETTVVPIILDGENAWEYFPNDATEFLDLLYQRLGDDDEIQTVTMSEAANTVKARPLPSVFAGSWINHNFRIWIGHQEDNAAWDLLFGARDALVEFERAHRDYDSEKLSAAWNQIFIAEGSDWCWWYGDEHRGDHNEQFDRIFRRHLVAVYELLDLDIPLDLLRPVCSGGTESAILLPECRLTPAIDGRISHFYEWTGAGFFNCEVAGGAMHQVDRYITGIHFAHDLQYFHIRLDFRSIKALELTAGLRAVITFFVPSALTVNLDLDKPADEDELTDYRYALSDILEFSVRRKHLWPSGYGRLSFAVALFKEDQKLESWPEHEPIQVDVPESSQEIFWPS